MMRQYPLNLLLILFLAFGVLSSAALAIGTPVTLPLSSQSIVRDGSFEEAVVPSHHFSTYGAGSSFGGWTVSTGSIDLLSDRDWQAADGRQSIDLSGNSAGTIYQNLPTVAGTTYQVRLALAGNPTDVPSIKRIAIWWDSTLLGELSFDTTGRSHRSMGWKFFTFTIQADKPVTRLQIQSLTMWNAPQAAALEGVR